ncbi:MAG: ATP-binding protein [Lachnospiraceae bacterium]|nr:ATP-binding protein [Lachnospiraceae bacterium]
MKNNIIISGVPRAGKSTVSHLLSKQYGYQHISMDSIIAGFEKCFPETGVNTYSGLSSMDTLHVISRKMAPFARAMLDSGEYDEYEPGMVLDMYQLLPEDYMKYIHGANCEIFYFITSDVTPEERFAIQKKYDTEKDYTFYKSDEELREGAVYIVEQSILMKEQCLRYGLPYFETARNRERVIEEFLQELSILHNK